MSNGLRRKTRKLFTKKHNLTIFDHLKEFEPLELVNIRIAPQYHRGMPFKRFHGRTAIVKEKRGRGYLVEVLNKKKKTNYSFSTSSAKN